MGEGRASTTGDGGLVTYCGIYCGDCLGYTGVIAKAADAFLDVLDEYKFYMTARNVFPGELGDYDGLIDMLLFMTEMKCHKPCRDRTDEEASCVVRDCCKARGLYACYECSEFERCEALESVLGGLHLGACLQNLREIREMGLEAWLRDGTRHHYWDE
jgi:hypothetical protein